MASNTIFNPREFAANLKPEQEYKDSFKAFCASNPPRISTGYRSLDIILNGGLVDEFYVMAAETSTGKSAFMFSLAMNIAQSGTADVLYFALEMKREEFEARATSCVSYEHHIQDPTCKAISAAYILSQKYDKGSGTFSRVPVSQYDLYIDEYFERFGDHLIIIPSKDDRWSAKEIVNVCACYKEAHPDRQCVVFIDYLQYICPDKSSKMSTRRDSVDESTNYLKQLVTQYHIPTFAASSIGRDKYHSAVGIGSFKESGNIEYTGSVLFGWNWCGVTDQPDIDKRDIEKQRCKNTGYRNMKLEILKYRNGDRDSSVEFRYYPVYSYIVDLNEFHPIPNNDENPFDTPAPRGRTIFC